MVSIYSVGPLRAIGHSGSVGLPVWPRLCYTPIHSVTEENHTLHNVQCVSACVCPKSRERIELTSHKLKGILKFEHARNSLSWANVVIWTSVCSLAPVLQLQSAQCCLLFPVVCLFVLLLLLLRGTFVWVLRGDDMSAIGHLA